MMTGKIDNIHPGLIEILDRLEFHMGFELTINSGYREAGHNTEVGGVDHSEHTYNPAEGVDVLCKQGSTRYKMKKWLYANDVKRIGTGKDFIHIGIATDKPQEVEWTYYPK
jgi:hypothetical protein